MNAAGDAVRKNSKNTVEKEFDMGVYVNQVGYYGKGEKRAVLPFSCEKFRLSDEKGNTCYEGKTLDLGIDLSAGDHVFAADFSDFAKPGIYRVCAEGVSGGEESAVFRIGEQVYDGLLGDLMKAFYYLRCGCDLEPQYAGQYQHPACHMSKAKDWADRSYEKDVHGGWHDAGDYGRYITAGATALAHLLYSYRMWPETMKAHKVQIPESGNGVPDILNECRYELEWILKMQREDGAVWHKVTTAQHIPFIMPQKDLDPLYLSPISSSATADLSAICAMAAAIYEEYDSQFAGELKKAAEKSYVWLKQHPELIEFKNPKGCGTGEYGEWEDYSNRFWAAVEMYSLTGEEEYHKDLAEAWSKPFRRTALGYSEVGGFGMLSYLLTNQKQDMTLRNAFLKEFACEAAQRVKASGMGGYGVGMQHWEYIWGSNMEIMKAGMYFAIADYFGLEDEVKSLADNVELAMPPQWVADWIEDYYTVKPEEQKRDEEALRRCKEMYEAYSLRDHAAVQLDYLLGLNAMGVSYVTGQGEYAYKEPHLRPTHCDEMKTCMPGMVSGGPCEQLQDPIIQKTVTKGTPPMKCYVDHWESYSTNEITIYWNSPAVFVTAYLIEKNL